MNKIDKANNYIKANKDNVKNDYRLNYHLMGDCGWINDPNGFIQYKNVYNLFYQYNPYKPVHELMHWGHAVSEDLIKWRSLPVALAPDREYDKSGCFSGSTIEKDKRLYIIYTGHVKDETGQHTETQCMAYSNDGINFKKYDNNPIISVNQIPDDASKNDFRDPKIFKYKENYYIIVGSNDGKGKGQAILYKSNDLINWKFINIVARAKKNMGDMWECPDIFKLDGKYMFMVSEIYEIPVKIHSAIYMIGDYDFEKNRFKYKNYFPVDYGFDFYAAQTILDNKGRRIMIAWMDNWETTCQELTDNHNWSGAMTLPRKLFIKDNKLYSKPVDEIKKYRKNESVFKEITLSNEMDLGIKGDSYEIKVLFENIGALEFGLKIRASEYEETVLSYNTFSHTFKFNRDKSGIGPKGERRTEVYLKDNTLTLDIFVDKCSVEVFINDGEKVMTGRIYPHNDAINIKAFSKGKVK